MQKALVNPLKKTTGNNFQAQKFGLWLAIVSMLMLFAALTSAYLVRRSAGNWLEFKLPDIFLYSTIVILASSVTLHSAYLAFKRGNATLYRTLLGTTFVLGIAFLVLQYTGWSQLNEIDIRLQTNPSASFLFVISGLHAAHLLGGLGALTVALVHGFRLRYKVTPRRIHRLGLTMTYWHFVDILWVYLFLFLLMA